MDTRYCRDLITILLEIPDGRLRRRVFVLKLVQRKLRFDYSFPCVRSPSRTMIQTENYELSFSVIL